MTLDIQTSLPLFLAALLITPVGLSGCYDFAGPRDDDDTSDDDDSASDDDDTASDDDDTSSDDDDTSDDCSPEGDTTCWGNEWMECTGAEWEIQDVCVDPTPLCDNALGCLACQPDIRGCDGNTVIECLPDGSANIVIEECDPEDTCISGSCVSACDLAEQQLTYLGCEFLAVTTANLVTAAFNSDFGVVIGNPSGGNDAEVTISRGGTLVASETIPAGSTQAIQLDMVPALKDAQESAVVVDGAYEIVSDVPVAAYQYNPLHYSIGVDFSYTNDASLLLPEHVLSGNYMVSTWPTWGRGTWTDLPLPPPLGGPQGDWNAWYPGFVSVAATQDGTSVTFDSSTYTHSGNPGALAPGGTTTLTLNRGDVVQIFSQRPSTSSDWNYCANQGWTSATNSCPPSFPNQCEAYCSVDGGDLTGSEVTASAPVAVFAGHMCTFMPFDTYACDHLEEMMFPTETWGTSTVMSAPKHPSGSGVAETYYRVLALNAGTQVTFDPAVHGPVTLGAGEFVQVESDQDFVISATSDIYVTQTMLGEDALGGSGGDPAMGSGIPTNQVRSSYDFLTPSSYTDNYVNVVVPQGAAIELDGSPVSGFSAIGSTGYEVARVSLDAGSHHIESATGVTFGITTYGYANYTSYLYPGGLNFTRGGP